MPPAVRSVLNRETLIPLGGVVAVVLTVLAIGKEILAYELRNQLQLQDIHSQLATMAKVMTSQWTQEQHEAWARELQARNAHLGLSVPLAPTPWDSPHPPTR